MEQIGSLLRPTAVMSQPSPIAAAFGNSGNLPHISDRSALFQLFPPFAEIREIIRKWRFLEESCPLPARHKPRSSRAFWHQKHPGDLNFFWLPRKNIVENQKTTKKKIFFSDLFLIPSILFKITYQQSNNLLSLFSTTELCPSAHS